MIIGALLFGLTLYDLDRAFKHDVFRSSAKRRNIVSSSLWFGLNCSRFVVQAHCLPRFSDALPPEKLALPLLAKPGFVAISFRHDSLLWEPNASTIPDRAASVKCI
jgi:hypothetical protein